MRAAIFVRGLVLVVFVAFIAAVVVVIRSIRHEQAMNEFIDYIRIERGTIHYVDGLPGRNTRTGRMDYPESVEGLQLFDCPLSPSLLDCLGQLSSLQNLNLDGVSIVPGSFSP